MAKLDHGVGYAQAYVKDGAPWLAFGVGHGQHQVFQLTEGQLHVFHEQVNAARATFPALGCPVERAPQQVTVNAAQKDIDAAYAKLGALSAEVDRAQGEDSKLALLLGDVLAALRNAETLLTTGREWMTPGS